MAKFIAACIQMNSGNDIKKNVARVAELAREAADKGADFITTPENVVLMSRGSKEQFEKSYGVDDHPGLLGMREIAADLKKWFLVGSLAVKREGEKKLANCSYLLNPKGEVVQHYDKIHLYDVQLENGEVYDESTRYLSGNQLKTAELPWGRLGMTICYDVRFPHLFRSLAHAGAHFITVPSAFVKYTGIAHWHTLLRARAIENASYIFAPAQTGKHPSGRETYGHSLIVDPWGNILADAKDGEKVITAEIDTARVEKVRKSLPSLKHDRKFS